MKRTPKQIEEVLVKELDTPKFEQHCQEVAANLNIDVAIVRDLLINNSLTVVNLLQKKAIKDAFIKINIRGFFSFVTKKYS